MKTKDLIHLGVPDGGEAMQLAPVFIREFITAGNDSARQNESCW